LITDRTNIQSLAVREAISYVFDDFRLDVKRQELQKNGNPVPLTYKAYRVLLILVQNSEQTVEKEYIYNELWGDSFVEDANLTQHIYVLRKTLGHNPAGESYIQTVARTGYRFVVPVRAVYPPQVTEAFFKPKTGVEPALEREPVSRPEPHLKLAEFPQSEIQSTESEEAVEQEQPSQPEPEKASSKFNKETVLILAAAALAALVIGIAIYFRSGSTSVRPQPIKSVAVLPFKPIGDESRNEKLGLGMADAIITNLSKLRQIPVRPTSSVVRYMDAPEPNSVAAGAELGVDTVLEGSVQLANERVRVSVQLIEVNGGKTIWADNFDEPFTDIFSVQDSISQKVVRSVATSLSQQQKDAARGGSTNSVEALTAYQMGVYLHSTRTKDNLFKAESYFLEAIKYDPQFAKAYAMLADTYNMQRYYGFADPRETRAKGLDAASRALELDNSTPEAYIAMANLQFGGKEGVAGAKRMLEKAIELSPYNSTAHLRYAWVVLATGDTKGAIEQMRLAQEYDPLSPVSNGAYCNMLSFEHRFKEAITFCEKAVELNPSADNGSVMLADMYAFDGRLDDAIATIQKRLAQISGDDNLMTQGSLAFYLARAGKRSEAELIISKLEASAARVPNLYNDLAVIFYELGEREKGLKYFKRAYEEHVLPVQMVRNYPAWEKVIADPEIRKILDEPPSDMRSTNVNTSVPSR
jgi:TolB-like protein/DNA-binding winged helix-turn-helix (wHTH) protein/lipopolysaccharide biosynthesis regulator YciM